MYGIGWQIRYFWVMESGCVLDFFCETMYVPDLSHKTNHPM